MTNSFISKSIEPKSFTQQGRSLFNTYKNTYINPKNPVRILCNIPSLITAHQPQNESDCKYNQYSPLNLNTGYQQNDAVIFNPK